MKRKHLLAALLSMVALVSEETLAQTQNIDPDPTTQNVAGGAVAVIDVIYTTANPIDATLAGIGVRIHWDSSALQAPTISNIFSTGLLTQGPPEPDTENADGDLNTDMFINIAWANFAGNWPGVGNTPTLLYTAQFPTISGFGSTTVNFSSSSTAAGRTLQSTSATIINSYDN